MIDKTLEKFVTELMGKKPEYRFKFIQDNAKFVDDLDI
jgi:DNA gyrase/topoisomerase IV subunit B